MPPADAPGQQDSEWSALLCAALDVSRKRPSFFSSEIPDSRHAQRRRQRESKFALTIGSGKGQAEALLNHRKIGQNVLAGNGQRECLPVRERGRTCPVMPNPTILPDLQPVDALASRRLGPAWSGCASRQMLYRHNNGASRQPFKRLID